MKNKITLKEFFDSDERLAIHCDTEEKATKLLIEFNKLGKKWSSKDSYLGFNPYTVHKDRTCYSNKGEYSSVEQYKKRDYKIYSFEDIIFEEKSLIPEIAKLLGVTVGEEFKIKGWSSYPYKFDGVLLSRTNGNEWEHATANDYEYILTGKCTIQKLPKKAPQLTGVERVILEKLPKEFKWIARDESDYLYIYEEIPRKLDLTWQCSSKDFDGLPFYHLFQFIKWEDKKPYNIKKLLKGE